MTIKKVSVSATAPGKIILFGEHSVVYGHPALAVPVTQVQATCEVKFSPHELSIVACDLDQTYNLQQAPDDNPLAKVVWLTLNELSITPPPNIKVSIFSNIPIACGLGSGAAVSTAIVRALGEYFEHEFPPEVVSEIALSAEKIYHGSPSGIDNTVVAFSQPVFFKKKHPIERFKPYKPLTFVIGDTGVKSETHKVVGDLRRRWQDDKGYYEAYFAKMGEIAENARIAIEQGDILRVGAYMTENHKILDEIGISNPELNNLVQAAATAGALGSKLSGAGWGGNMIALVKSEEANYIAEVLQQAGAKNTIITVVN